MSRFLPENFDASRPLVLIAGRDNYPALMAERARAAGVTTRLVELKGETSAELVDRFTPEERTRVKVGQVGKLLKALRKKLRGARSPSPNQRFSPALDSAP